MCYITVIAKIQDKNPEEFKIKLPVAELPSLETPYYVTVEIIGNDIIMDYSYSENSKLTSELNSENLSILYGEKTGRVFKVQIHGIEQDLSELDSIIERYNANNWSDVKRNNLNVGISILKEIRNKINDIL